MTIIHTLYTFGLSTRYPKWGKHPGDDGWYDYMNHDGTFTWDVARASTSSKSQTNIKINAVHGGRTSDETRPKNMRVVYIMKIF